MIRPTLFRHASDRLRTRWRMSPDGMPVLRFIRWLGFDTHRRALAPGLLVPASNQPVSQYRWDHDWPADRLNMTRLHQGSDPTGATSSHFDPTPTSGEQQVFIPSRTENSKPDSTVDATRLDNSQRPPSSQDPQSGKPLTIAVHQHHTNSSRVDKDTDPVSGATQTQKTSVEIFRELQARLVAAYGEDPYDNVTASSAGEPPTSDPVSRPISPANVKNPRGVARSSTSRARTFVRAIQALHAQASVPQRRPDNPPSHRKSQTDAVANMSGNTHLSNTDTTSRLDEPHTPTDAAHHADSVEASTQQPKTDIAADTPVVQESGRKPNTQREVTLRQMLAHPITSDTSNTRLDPRTTTSHPSADVGAPPAKPSAPHQLLRRKPAMGNHAAQEPSDSTAISPLRENSQHRAAHTPHAAKPVDHSTAPAGEVNHPEVQIEHKVLPQPVLAAHQNSTTGAVVNMHAGQIANAISDAVKERTTQILSDSDMRQGAINGVSAAARPAETVSPAEVAAGHTALQIAAPISYVSHTTPEARRERAITHLLPLLRRRLRDELQRFMR